MVQIKALLKRPAYVVLLTISWVVDLARYTRNASVIFMADSDRKLEALIRKDNHRIEKGLALPQPRVWFGEAVLYRLNKNLREYVGKGKARSDLLDESHTVISEYEKAFLHNGPAPKNIFDLINGINEVLGSRNPCVAGTLEIRKDDVAEMVDIDYERFVRSRFSVRQFDGSVVSSEVVSRAVELATKTPSVCNRCAWKVYNISGAERVSRVLSCQNGNAGFGHTVGNVLIVVSDLRCFEGGGERNQAFVDGGLFAMNLVHALHREGVASCFLNWSADVFQDQRLRKLLRIPSHEVVITFIAIGGYPDTVRVAVSPRPRVNDVLFNLQ